MRNLTLVFLIMLALKGTAQNEFAATVFYNDFKKIQMAAADGFSEFKGSKVPGMNNGIIDKYRIKLLLPLADSGWIIIPTTGAPYVEYFFQTSRTKQEIDQRAVNLREALLTAYGKPLFTRTETYTLNDHIFSNTYFYKNLNDSAAIFRSSIYQEDKRKYFLTLKIVGDIR